MASHTSPARSIRPAPLGTAAAVQYVTNDHVRVSKIEDRLKQWHAQLGEDSKTQIRALTRYVNTKYINIVLLHLRFLIAECCTANEKCSDANNIS